MRFVPYIYFVRIPILFALTLPLVGLWIGGEPSRKMRVWERPHGARSNIRRAWTWPRTIPASPATDRYVANRP